MAAINYHRQHEFVTLHFYRGEVQHRSLWAKTEESERLSSFLEDIGENLTLCPLHARRTVLGHLLSSPSSKPATGLKSFSHGITDLCLCLPLPILRTFVCTVDLFGQFRYCTYFTFSCLATLIPSTTLTPLCQLA